MARVRLITHTPEPEKLVAAAAKLCYSAADIDTMMESLDEAAVARFVDMLAEIGHESPIEHASFTFALEGVSRSLLAQITRHRIASFSVQSQRYVKEKDFGAVVPPEIGGVPEAEAIFGKAMEAAAESYDRLAAILRKKHIEAMLGKEGLTEETADEKTLKQIRRKAGKKAIEDARYVLPNACETKMIVTMNARSLQNFFRHRCCNRAQWEIREVAEEMLVEVKKVAPLLFSRSGPPCLNGPCTEGKMTCGKMAEVREHYKSLG